MLAAGAIASARRRKGDSYFMRLGGRLRPPARESNCPRRRVKATGPGRAGAAPRGEREKSDRRVLATSIRGWTTLVFNFASKASRLSCGMPGGPGAFSLSEGRWRDALAATVARPGAGARRMASDRRRLRSGSNSPSSPRWTSSRSPAALFDAELRLVPDDFAPVAAVGAQAPVGPFPPNPHLAGMPTRPRPCSIFVPDCQA